MDIDIALYYFLFILCILPVSLPESRGQSFLLVQLLTTLNHVTQIFAHAFFIYKF